MKLGVVTASFPRFPGDPAGHFVASHAELLRRAGHAVEVVAAGDGVAPRRELRPGGLAPTPLADAGAGGADVAPLAITRVASPLFFAGGAPEAITAAGWRAALPAAGLTARLAATTALVSRRAAGWDATAAHWLVPAALAAVSVRGPLLAIAHGGDVHLLRRAGLLAPALAALLGRRARLAFVSEELAALARAALPAPLRRRFDAATLVQPMGVDLAHFAGLAADTARPQPRPYALVLARLVPIKGVELALAAFSALAAAGAPARAAGAPARAALELVIAGDGPERARLERLAAADPATAGRVRFLGALPTAARDAWLAHAAAVVLPSRRLPGGRGEGTPQVALEALAAGVPLLAAATGGLAALPPPARLLPEHDRDPRRWAAALADLLAAPPPPAALRAVVQPLDWPAVATALGEHWLGRVAAV